MVRARQAGHQPCTHPKGAAGPSLPRSSPLGWLTCTHISSSGSGLLCCPGEEWGLILSVAAGKEQGRGSAPELTTLWAAFLAAGGGKVGAGESITSALVPPHGSAAVGSGLPHSRPWGPLSHTPATKASSAVLPGPGKGPTLPSVPACAQPGQLSRMLHAARGGSDYSRPPDIHVVPADCPDQGHSHVLWGYSKRGP